LTFNGKDKQPRNSSTNKPALSTGTQKQRKTLGSLRVPPLRLNKEEMANKLAILEQDLMYYQRSYGNSFLKDKRIRKLVNLRDKLRLLARMDGDGGVIDSNGTIAMREAPFDIPVIAEDGATVIQRHVRVIKAASSGTAGSGYYAQLLPTDLADFGQPATSGVKIKKITSYTLGAEEATVAIATNSTTELLGASVTNFTRIGAGFCGIVTDFPLGDFPLFLLNSTASILGHNVGTTSGLKVIFDCIIEILI
jgi:hypothetical protein